MRYRYIRRRGADPCLERARTNRVAAVGFEKRNME
jgi:hypothetical protein